MQTRGVVFTQVVFYTLTVGSKFLQNDSCSVCLSPSLKVLRKASTVVCSEREALSVVDLSLTNILLPHTSHTESNGYTQDRAGPPEQLFNLFLFWSVLHEPSTPQSSDLHEQLLPTRIVYLPSKIIPAGK